MPAAPIYQTPENECALEALAHGVLFHPLHERMANIVKEYGFFYHVGYSSPSQAENIKFSMRSAKW